MRQWQRGWPQEMGPIYSYTFNPHGCFALEPRSSPERPQACLPIAATRDRQQSVTKRPSAGWLQATVADRPKTGRLDRRIGIPKAVVRTPEFPLVGDPKSIPEHAS